MPDGVQTRRADQITSLYVEAELRLRVLIGDAVASGQLALARYRQDRLSEVAAQLATVQAAVVPEATNAVTDAYVTGSRRVNPEGAFGVVHQGAVELLADNLVGRLDDTVQIVGRRADDVFRREALRLSALSLVEGSTDRQATEALRKALVDQGVKGFRDRAGREWNLAAYSRMALRGTLHQAVNQAVVNRVLEDGGDVVEWVAAADARPEHAALEGRYSLTGRTEGLPRLEQQPPLDPNCRCSLLPAEAA